MPTTGTTVGLAVQLPTGSGRPRGPPVLGI